MSSGSKRPWEGGSVDVNKRPKDRDVDWKDVHLRSSGQSRHTSSRYDSDRHGRGTRRDSERDRRRRHSRDQSRRSPKRSRTPQRSPTSDRKVAYAPVDEEREEGEISPHHSPEPSPKVEDFQPSKSPQQTTPAPVQVEVEMELEMPSSPPPIESTLAARRAKRQAILAKYAGIASVDTTVSPSPGPNSAVPRAQTPSATSNPISKTNSRTESPAPQNGQLERQTSVAPSAAHDDFFLEKDNEQSNVQATAQDQNIGPEQVSAADYDPSQDRREDEHKRLVNNDAHDIKTVEEEEEYEEEEEEEVDDMFAALTTEKKVVKKVRKVIKPVAPALVTMNLDSGADVEGYYQVILGEQLDGGRYQVFSSLGKGMFANVVRARILQGESGDTGREVAIKIVRQQESMYRAGLKEVQILNRLKQADPDDKKHLVRLERTFEHRGHLCLVFESLSMNLREVVKRFGKDVGLNIKAVRAYAQQLFTALGLLKKLNIMHADIKPDNILVNEAKTVVKLCDLGSASDASENEITPYLVSRFYRAPEIILGVPYDPALDIWSIGCTLYELYTGKILFPGRSNNHMLLLMMELKGRFNTRMIRKAKFGDMYFDELGTFQSIEHDRVTNTDVVKKVHMSKPTRDLRGRLMPPSSIKMKDDESKLLMSFIDLLDKCLVLDPGRRITPKEALSHPFIRG